MKCSFLPTVFCLFLSLTADISKWWGGPGDLGIVSVALSIRTVGTKTGKWGHCTLGDREL